MLYLVLALVVAAFALLIAALATANTLWAWISVVVSVVAAVLLVIDWLVGRRKLAATVAARTDEAQVPRAGAVDEDGTEDGAPESVPVGEPAETTAAAAAQGQPADAAAPDDEEPAEEATDATDVLVISELSVEVRVVDEHPRYHLATCTWLGDRQTIPLPVSEARELGFTPCARCGPDAVLAARHRVDKGATQ